MSLAQAEEEAARVRERDTDIRTIHHQLYTRIGNHVRFDDPVIKIYFFHLYKDYHLDYLNYISIGCWERTAYIQVHAKYANILNFQIKVPVEDATQTVVNLIEKLKPMIELCHQRQELRKSVSEIQKQMRVLDKRAQGFMDVLPKEIT